MRNADNFEPTYDDFHLEEWEALLDNFLLSHKDIEFLFNRQYGVIIIEHHPENVPVFNYSDSLFNIILASTVKDFLEEGSVVVEIVCHHEFGLEACPNVVVFHLLWLRSQLHL